MKKLLILIPVIAAVSACTERTTLDVECHDGLLTYEYTKTWVETDTQLDHRSGIMQYRDNRPVKCVE